MITLIHSSKTMKPYNGSLPVMTAPLLIEQATALSEYLRSLSITQLKESMKLSDKLAMSVKALIDDWGTSNLLTSPAIYCFKGDIYSGLQAMQLSKEDIIYANNHLRILSGLYGILRPLDGIYPYRLEMGYKFTDEMYKNMYTYWSNVIANTIPKDEDIINLASLEYVKTILPYVTSERVYTPVFLTYSPKSNKYTTVAVHSKIARGAFARWLITNRLSSVSYLSKFNDLGYTYNKELSTKHTFVYLCDTFGGIGLSTRLS